MIKTKNENYNWKKPIFSNRYSIVKQDQPWGFLIQK